MIGEAVVPVELYLRILNAYRGGVLFAKKNKFIEDTEDTEPSPNDCRSIMNAFLSNGSLYL